MDQSILTSRTDDANISHLLFYTLKSVWNMLALYGYMRHLKEGSASPTLRWFTCRFITLLLNEGPKKIHDKWVVTIGIKRWLLPTTLIPERILRILWCVLSQSGAVWQTEQRDVSSPSHFPNCKLNVLNMQSFGPRTVADHKPANSLVLSRQPRASIATALL